MVGVSWILNEGDFKKNYPSFGWAMGVGMSMILFTPAVILLGAIAATGVGIFVLVAGAIALIGLAKTMVAVSDEISKGDWSGNYPSLKWSLGVGTALMMFSNAFAVVSVIKGIGSLFGGELDFNEFVKTAATAMVAASNSLQGGIWDTGFPDDKWAKGVGGSLMMFAKAFADISGTESGGLFSSGSEINFNEFVKKAAESMVTASESLQGGIWDTGFPDDKWAKGVGGSLMMFAEAFSSTTSTKNGGWFSSGSKINFNEFVKKAAESMVLASYILSKGSEIDGVQYVPDWSAGFPSPDWAGGVGGALQMFAKAFADISDTESGGWFSEDKDFSVFIKKAAQSMVLASNILSVGYTDIYGTKYEPKWGGGYPTKEWSDGVKLALSSFSGVKGSSFDDDNLLSVVSTAMAMSMVSSILLSTNNWSSYPTEEWVDGVSYSLNEIGDVIDDMDLDMEEMINFEYFLDNIVTKFSSLSSFPSLDPFVENVNNFSNVLSGIPTDKYKAIDKLSNSIVDFSKSLDDVNLEAIDKLSAISQGVMLVSIIDNEKLKSTLDTISEKKGELQEIYGDENKKNMLEKAGNFFSGLIPDGFGKFGDDKDKTDTITKPKVDTDKEEFYANTAQMLDTMREIQGDIEQLVLSIKSDTIV
jgi:hypothetical protein